jgi:hypothetical protein
MRFSRPWLGRLLLWLMVTTCLKVLPRKFLDRRINESEEMWSWYRERGGIGSAIYRWLWKWTASGMRKCGWGKECEEGLVWMEIKWTERIDKIEWSR